jgi:tetratricopeptide (TPR) repeat protein
MKSIKLIFSALVVVFLFTSQEVSAQNEDSKFGTDSIECLKQSSLYREFVKQKNYHDAISHWKWTFENCPKSSRNIYLDGVKIYSDLIGTAKSEAERTAFVDTLMQVYQARITHFGQEDFVKGRMGIDLLRFQPSAVTEAYDHLSFSIKNLGKSSEYAVAVTFMQASSFMYKNNSIPKERTLEDFTIAMKSMEESYEYFVVKGDQDKADKVKSAIQNIETYFMESGAADCGVLIPYFTPKFNETPGDVELLKNITKILDKAECNDSDLYYDASKQLHKLSPSAESAVYIARAALKREIFTESVEFYKQAIELQQDKLEKARYYYELGLITFSQLHDYEGARRYALLSLENDPTNGKAYILIGNLYASSGSRCGDDDFKQRTVYWAAVDKFEMAKKADSSLAIDANKLINAYSAQFPNGEILFFNNLTEGSVYTVGCWINEKTRVRKSN